MNFKRLLHSGLGKIFISILLGLGIATLFRKVCKDKNCIHFKGPLTGEVDGKVFKHGDQCYKYVVQNAEKCNPNKKVVDLETVETAEMPTK